jgi:hypothetical protein
MWTFYLKQESVFLITKSVFSFGNQRNIDIIFIMDSIFNFNINFVKTLYVSKQCFDNARKAQFPEGLHPVATSVS